MKYKAVAFGAQGRLARFIADSPVKRPGFLRGAAYAGFFFAAFFVCLAWRFPSGAIVELAGKYAQDAGLRLTAASAGFRLPLGVRMEGVALSSPSPDKNMQVAAAENIEAGIPVFSAVTLRKGAYIRARALGGSIAFNMSQKLFNRGVTDASLSLDGINPGLLPALAESGLAKFNGSLGGDGSFSFEGSDPLKGSGSLKARLTRPASITLSKTIGGDAGDVAVEMADIEMSFKSGSLNFDRVVIKGPLVSISVTGDAIVNPNPRFTRLNIKTQVHLYGKLAERLGPLLSFFPKGQEGETVIKVTGTVGSPAFH